MTLSERVEQIWAQNPLQKICIGVTSGWMFIGDKALYDKWWEQLSQRHLFEYMDIRSRAEVKLNEMLSADICIDVPKIEPPKHRVPDEIDAYVNKLGALADMLAAFIDDLDTHISVMRRYSNRLRIATDYINAHTDVNEREVLDEYEVTAIADKPCIGLIIAGTEQGGFWMEEEFKEYLCSLEHLKK